MHYHFHREVSCPMLHLISNMNCWIQLETTMEMEANLIEAECGVL